MNNVAVFAHFDKDSLIDSYVVDYLKKLSKVADVVFVSDNELAINELLKIKKYIICAICEKHGEYDFGSYKRGINKINQLGHNYSNLILCNDSCYFVDDSFVNILNYFVNNSYDFGGITQNLEIALHVQSYFLIFSNKVFKSQCFIDFFKNIRAEKTKFLIIKKYEIGLSQILFAHGFKHTVFCFKAPIIQANTLFVKVELFRDNPRGYKQLHSRFSSLALPYQQMIVKHLLRISNDFYFAWFYRFTNKKQLWVHKNFMRFELINRKYFILMKVRLIFVISLKMPIYFHSKNKINNLWRNFCEESISINAGL